VLHLEKLMALLSFNGVRGQGRLKRRVHAGNDPKGKNEKLESKLKSSILPPSKAGRTRTNCRR